MTKFLGDTVQVSVTGTWEGVLKDLDDELIDNPIQVHAPWNVGNWSWRRFPTIEAANQALAELRAALPETYVRSTSDPLISVGTYGRRGWSWS